MKMYIVKPFFETNNNLQQYKFVIYKDNDYLFTFEDIKSAFFPQLQIESVKHYNQFDYQIDNSYYEEDKFKTIFGYNFPEKVLSAIKEQLIISQDSICYTIKDFYGDEHYIFKPDALGKDLYLFYKNNLYMILSKTDILPDIFEKLNAKQTLTYIRDGDKS